MKMWLLCFQPFLGAFTKLQKAAVSFILSVCLSIYVEELGAHWPDIREI